jgi:hypothetical protein
MTDLGSTTLVEAPRVAENEREREPEEPCLSTAEVAECTCPDFCERDHDTD